MRFVRRVVRLVLAAIGLFFGLSFCGGLALALFGSMSGDQAVREIGGNLVLLPIGAFLLLIFSPLGESIAYWPSGSGKAEAKANETKIADEKRPD